MPSAANGITRPYFGLDVIWTVITVRILFRKPQTEAHVSKYHSIAFI